MANRSIDLRADCELRLDRDGHVLVDAVTNFHNNCQVDFVNNACLISLDGGYRGPSCASSAFCVYEVDEQGDPKIKCARNLFHACASSSFHCELEALRMATSFCLHVLLSSQPP